MSATQRATLQALTRSTSTPVRQLVRARALLLAADGIANDRIAADLALSATTVRSWRARFVADGLAQLGRVRPGQGAKQTISADTVRAIVQATIHTQPADQPYWSCQAMAERFGISAATVYRIWRANGLKPHLVQSDINTAATQADSTDVRSIYPSPDDTRRIDGTTTPICAPEDKVTDVVGVLLTPHERVFALCLDEGSRLQAADRASQQVLYSGRRPELMTNGGRRNSTTTLFAALNVLTESLLQKPQTRSTARWTKTRAPAAARPTPQHPYEDLLRFLSALDEAVPQHLAVHLVLDNCITYQHADLQRWLDRHTRFHLLFAPTPDSWLGLAEQWLRGLCDTAPRGSFSSVPALIGAIEKDTCRAESVAAQPTTAFRWTATRQSILAGLRGSHRTLALAVGQ